MMAQYDLENLFMTSMEGLKKLVIDTETIVGKPIELTNGTIINRFRIFIVYYSFMQDKLK